MARMPNKLVKWAAERNMTVIALVTEAIEREGNILRAATLGFPEPVSPGTLHHHLKRHNKRVTTEEHTVAHVVDI